MDVPTQAQLLRGVPCCALLRRVIAGGLTALTYEPIDRSVAIVDRSPDFPALQKITWCPFCGRQLLADLSARIRDVLGDIGDTNAPEFSSDAWWVTRIALEADMFDLQLPEIATVLSIPLNPSVTRRAVVVGVRPCRSNPRMLLAMPSRSSGDTEAHPSLAVGSPWAYARGNWPVVGMDDDLAIAIAGRVEWNSPVSGGDPDWLLPSPRRRSSSPPLPPVSDIALTAGEICAHFGRGLMA